VQGIGYKVYGIGFRGSGVRFKVEVGIKRRAKCMALRAESVAKGHGAIGISEQSIGRCRGLQSS